MVSSKILLLIAPVHIFTKPVHNACTGTHFYHFYHGQSEVALKDQRPKTVVHDPELYTLNFVPVDPKLLPANLKL